MKHILLLVAGIITAFLIYSLLLQVSISFTLVINVFSVVVIYVAISRGEIYGAFTGMACGLIQDSFAMGVFGVAGIAKTLIGYMAGYFAQKINVTPFTRKFVFSSALLYLELILWSFLYVSIFGERLHISKGLIFLQPLLTALIVCSLFLIAPKIRAKLTLWRR
jgi:rod shape-determining protein MreD